MRWYVTAYYRTDNGLLDIPYEIEELSDLEEVIERGPHFGTIDRIEIRYAHSDESLTVELAETI
jgi:hypothetical protein